MIYRTRDQWESSSQPVVGPSILLDQLDLIPAHYTAASSIPSDTAQYLRNIQNDYTVNRGYSIGYNFAIDQEGIVWECRGVDIKCAANKGANDWTVAVLCLVDGADAMSPVMVDPFKELGAYIQDATGHAELLVVGHRDIGSTSCPGDGIYHQVVTGQLDPLDWTQPQPPQPQPKPPTGDDDMATAILHIEGRHAQFIGQGPLNPDGSVHLLFVTWLGPGPSLFVDDHTAAPDVVHQPTLAGTLSRDLVFLGNPDEINDGLYRWTDADFYRVVR